jgi:hypothetical protein
MSSCASCNSCRLCSIFLSAFLGVLFYLFSSLNSRNLVSPGCVWHLAQFIQCLPRGFPLFYCRWGCTHGAVHILMCAAVSRWYPHLGHLCVDLYPHIQMNFPVPVIPCLCFMTHIHLGIEALFAAGRLAGTSISSVSCRSLKSHLFAASGWLMKLYIFPLTFEESFPPCIHNNHGSVKLPQPQMRTRTYTQTGQSTLRATQVRAALSHAYDVTYQNRITDKP